MTEIAPRVRDAATVILVRDRASEPRVLMGTRGAGAAFMPNKMVFPGGAVDPNDALVALAHPLSPEQRTALSDESAAAPEALVAAAIRELWEETGQCLGAPGDWTDAPRGWRGFAATGHRPDPRALRLVFRAITPPGRPRRFDARFLLADADALVTDPDDFGRAEDELGHLHWRPIAEARAADLPFITEVVLAEVLAGLRSGPDWPAPGALVPFFRLGDEARHIRRLGGRRPLDAI